MLDWTDRHCRYFHRLLTQQALLYTEMVTTGALLHGDVARHLRFHEQEHPLSLQLGGSDPKDLAHCASLAQAWGYDEVNLNCGCPSERVQKGAFGACLMAEPILVADCVKAMVDAVGIPVTVKHRIGIDDQDHYGFVRDFVGTVAQAGCRTFVVHARSAWLKGLSPKENREIPPLRPQWAYQLKADFPELIIVMNGGVAHLDGALIHLSRCDGVMAGRSAYHDPWWLSTWDSAFWNRAPQAITRDDVERQMVDYMTEQARQHGTPWYAIARHMLGLRNGLPGARKWRQVWSDHRLKPLQANEVARMASDALHQRPSPAGDLVI
jgi:tRNA-dihydrouridine synthase A